MRTYVDAITTSTSADTVATVMSDNSSDDDDSPSEAHTVMIKTNKRLPRKIKKIARLRLTCDSYCTITESTKLM